MNKKARLKLIRKLAIAGKSSRRSRPASTDRDIGIVLAPTLDDIDEELQNMSGFREKIQPTDAEEIFFGMSDFSNNYGRK